LFRAPFASYQHILELDVPVDKTPAVQIPHALDHIDADREPTAPVQARLHRHVQVAPHPLHHEQDRRRLPAAVRVVDHRAQQPHDVRVVHHLPRVVQLQRQVVPVPLVRRHLFIQMSINIQLSNPKAM